MARIGKSGFAGIAVGVLILCFGVATLMKGKLQYPNYWGGPVFAPFAILVGVLGIFVGIVSVRKARR